MSTIRAHTAASDLEIETNPDETILETLRRYALPAQGFLLKNDDGGFISLTQSADSCVTIHAFCVGNADFSLLKP